MNKKNMNRSKRKTNRQKFHRLQVFIGFAVFVLICAVAAVFGYRWLRNRGKQVVPETDVDIPVREDVFYRQKDERWAADKLGDSYFSMGSSGCLVCCIAASLELQGREVEHPGHLNQELSQKAGYDKEGNLQWDALSRIDSRIQVERCKEVDAASLQESFKAGRFPIVRVRTGKAGNVHYVLIIGAKEGEYWCMDPLEESSKPVPLSKFGNRVYAVRYVDFVQ